MKQQRNLHNGMLCQLTVGEEGLLRHIEVDGEEKTQKLFPSGTRVKIIQCHPWIQVEVVDQDGKGTDERFGIGSQMIEEIGALSEHGHLTATGRMPQLLSA